MFISNDNSWSSIKISYIIAARSDIQVGFFIVDAFSATSNTLTFSNALVGWSPRTTSVSAAVYLAGLRTSSTSIQNCQITGASVNPANGILVVNVTLGSGGYVEFLYLSYAWWGNSPGLVVASYDPASGSAV